ncbi:MAG: tRNA epoxyqueuosine(34) reductase QueG [Planctomycetota bacterium]|nr:tRNA epoxyqueuosine(34) reductase QueG [Planctomycetota bacterium]
MPDLKADLKQRAAELGFVLSGVAAAASPGRLPALNRWLDSGFHGEMSYLETRREAYQHPNSIVDGCRSLLMLALPYDSSGVEEQASKIARYARGQIDYHDIIHARLKRLKSWLLKREPQAKVRGIVDTAPLLEREFAEIAGLGWVAKNTMLINRSWGSYFFLAAILTDIELTPDTPHEKSFCGTCTACLDNCPTGAFPEPFVLDATKCISYQTIENRDEVAKEVKPHFHEWMFGCDICQEVCPWNKHPKECDSELLPELESFNPVELLELTEEEFRERFRKTPFWRPRRRGMLRNAILSVGAQKLPEAVPALQRLLRDEEELIRMSAAWSLMQLDAKSHQVALQVALVKEDSPVVRENLKELLGRAEQA